MRKAICWVVFAVFCFGCGSSGGGATTGSGGSGGGGSGGGSGGVGGGASGGSSGTGGTTDAGLTACGTDNSTGSGDTCTTATATGPCVTEQFSTDTAPSPAGGTIVAGTYVLSSMTFFGPADGGDQANDRRETLVVSSVTVGGFTLDQVQASGTRVDRSHGTVVASGTTVTYTPTCPPPGDGGDNGGSASYTATATTFTLIESQNGGTRVSVYTKS